MAPYKKNRLLADRSPRAVPRPTTVPSLPDMANHISGAVGPPHRCVDQERPPIQFVEHQVEPTGIGFGVRGSLDHNVDNEFTRVPGQLLEQGGLRGGGDDVAAV